jgi:hypothetical protein
MLLLLPMNGDDAKSGTLVSINEVKKWALLEISEGKLAKTEFFDTREEIEEWIDAVIVISDFEPVMNFIEEQIMVLVAHTQRSIDDIVEAFIFKELHELSY